jgi:hypothetical protein
MKKHIILLFCGLITFAQCYSMKTIPMNPASVLFPAYQQIFLLNKPLTDENIQKWYSAINTITNFVKQNKNTSLMNAMRIVEELSVQFLDILYEIRNLAALVKTIKDKSVVNEYKQPLQNRLNKMRNMFFIAQDMIKKPFFFKNQENARQVLEGTIRFMRTSIMAEIQQELNQI